MFTPEKHTSIILKKVSPEFFENNMFNDDIRNVDVSEIPDFDILCADFNNLKDF